MNRRSAAPSSRATTHGRVLVVDDEREVRRSLARLLMAHGFEVLTAEDGPAALALLATTSVDVLLVDLAMPGMSGADVLDRVKQTGKDVEVLVTASLGEAKEALAAVEAGAYDVLWRPFAVEEAIPVAVARAAEHRALVLRARGLEERLSPHESLGEIVGRSAEIQEAYRLAMTAAPTRSPVLILGESGTGKDLLARSIHRHGSRADRPLRVVRCAGLPEGLLDLELFGTAPAEPGSAEGDRPGVFELAHEGTVYLAGIEDLSLAAQAKLLQVIARGEVTRAGAAAPRRADARVIASAPPDLKDRVRAGRFRDDLFYRLNVIAVRLPALRRRKEDIPLLAYHFLHKHARREGRDVRRISVEALRALRQEPWPGNVRELESAIEHAVVVARGESILPGDLPIAQAEKPGRLLKGDLEQLPYADAKARLVDTFDREYARGVMERAGGNISEAARQAGMDRSNFRRLLRKVGELKRGRGQGGKGLEDEESDGEG